MAERWLKSYYYQDKVCGSLYLRDDGKRVYRSPRNPKHWCRVLHTMGGIQLDIVEELAKDKCDEVHIPYTTAGGELENHHADFKLYLKIIKKETDEKGRNYGEVKTLHESDGAQVFLYMDRFRCPELEAIKEKKRKDKEAEVKRNPSLDLFG